MIVGKLHEGSGLGDQLFRYITVRTLAEEKGYSWCMSFPADFKGDSFMNIEKYSADFTKEKLFANWKIFREKEVRENGVDIRSYDPEINFIEDDTDIDGSFEDSKYWGHNLDNISKWLAVEPLNVPDDLCVIGFRGGEYYVDPNLGLPKEYFDEAVFSLRKTDHTMRFQVNTDDPKLAKQFFPDFEVVDNKSISHSKHTNMGYNWRAARYAKYAIIPNSAFFIIPRLLKHHEDPTAVTIAPRYWARHNTRTWARPACYYKQFTYI